MITLSWPSSKLSPNARGHWRKSKEAKDAYKEEGCDMALKCPLSLSKGDIHLKITFCPPDKRHRDLDNMLASIKYALDGVAIGWGVNDKRFRPLTLSVGGVVKGGMVTIEVIQ